MALLLLLLAAPIRPHAVLTPGAIRPLSQHTVCTTRWGLDKRHVTIAMKREVAAAYGVPWAKRHLYEFDHFIPRELGGADASLNLWPQAWAGTYGAHQKDRLENALHRRVCAGTMTLTFAQDAIRSDWVASYRLYIEAR